MPEDETENKAVNTVKSTSSTASTNGSTAGNVGEGKTKTERAAETTRRRRRDQFLADLAEAQRLRERVAPRRARMARLRQQQLMRTFLH